MLYPMAAMFVLTIIVMFIVLIVRIHAFKKGLLHRKFVKIGSDSKTDAPDYVIKAQRHYANLFEMPVFFYIACVVCIVLRLENQALLILAWLFVAFRIIHAIIHLTSNYFYHRFPSFLGGVLCLCIIWIIILTH